MGAHDGAGGALDTVIEQHIRRALRITDGKIHLAPTTLGDRPYAFQVASEDWPLAMNSPANSKMISSSFGEYNYPKLILDIHPHDAADRAIESGAEVRVFNELGEVHCTAKVNSRGRAGVVSMPKGAWVKSALNESTSTFRTVVNDFRK